MQRRMVLKKWKAANPPEFLDGEKMHKSKPDKSGMKRRFDRENRNAAGRKEQSQQRPPRDRDTEPQDRSKPEQRQKFDARGDRRANADKGAAPRGPNTRQAKRPKGADKNYVAGRKPVAELLESAPGRVDMVNIRKGRVDAKISAIVDLCADNGIRYKFVDAASLERLHKGNHQGVVAQVAGLEYTDLDTLLQRGLKAPLPLIIVLDRVQDTGNVGALARTLYALGGAGIVVPQHEGAYIGSGAIKASAGALTMLPVSKVVNVARTVEQLARQGWTTYCADQGEASENVFAPDTDLTLPGVLVLGNEEKGVRPGVAKACDRSLHIPFARRFDSLNVSSAGSSLMTLFALQATKNNG